MKKRNYIVLVAGAVLTVSVLLGGTYAWFSGQSSVLTGGLADGNGVEGGVVAGHVDLKFDLITYTKDGTGKMINGSLNSPSIIYPGDVVDSDGNAIPGGHSVIEWTLENTSGVNVIASSNLRGYNFFNAEAYLDYEGNNPELVAYNLKMYQLLGYDKQNGADMPTTIQPGASDGSWFYFSTKPSDNSIFKYVDTVTLNGGANSGQPNFITFPNRAANDQVYNLDGIAKWRTSADYPDGTPFYAPASIVDIFDFDKDKGGIHSAVSFKIGVDYDTIDALSNIASGNSLRKKYPKTHGIDFYSPDWSSAESATYFLMPAGAKIVHRLDLFCDYGKNPFNGATAMDNNFQFAVFTLNIEDKDENGVLAPATETDMEVYATQVKKEAVDSFYGVGVADSLPADWFN